jgi:FkbM family methyltransferase
VICKFESRSSTGLTEQLDANPTVAMAAELTGLDAYVEVAEVRLGKLAFPRTDRILGRCLREYGEWAQAEVDLLCDLLSPDGVALDIGAYIGTHTLAFARRLSGGRVHAFEPQPTFFSLLEHNVSANGLRGVSLHNVGLSDRRSATAVEAVDFAAEANFGGTRLGVPASGADTVTVQMRTLDEFDFERCDLLKIDVEGMEALVLAGARNTIERSHPVVYAECNSAEAGWPVIETMRRYEYDAYAFVPLAFNPGNFRGRSDNFLGEARELGLLFIPPLRRAAVTGVLARHQPLAPLGSLDDLVLALLRKPQYKVEVAACGRAATVLGTDFWLSEAEARQAAQLKIAFEQVQTLAWHRQEEIATLGQQLALTQTALEQTQALAIERFDRLQQSLGKLENLRRSWKARLMLVLTRGQRI